MSKRLSLSVVAICGAMILAGCATPSQPRPPRPVVHSAENVETFDAAWRIINDTHFDTNFNGVNWTAVGEELRPRAAEARSPAELREIMDNMLSRLGESHMKILPREIVDYVHVNVTNSAPPSTNNDLAPRSEKKRPRHPKTRPPSPSAPPGLPGDFGFTIRLIDKEVVVFTVDPDGPAGLAGVKPGWVLRRVGDYQVSAISKLLKSEITGEQRQFIAWSTVTHELMGPSGSTLSLDFLDQRNHRVPLKLTRRPETGAPSKLGNLPTLFSRFEKRAITNDSARIGFIRFNLFMIPVAASFDNAIDEFRHFDGIIVDLRGNLGGIGGMVMGLSGHFLNERVSLGTLKMRGAELHFYSNPRRVNTKGEPVEPFKGPMAILTDAISLSAAELFAGSLQALGRAQVFGERTGGQALPALFDRLPNGDVLYHAFADFTGPVGERLEGKGVTPNETTPLSREALLEGRDPALEAAVKFISKQR